MNPSPTGERRPSSPMIATLGCASFVAGAALVITILFLWRSNETAEPTPTLVAAAATAEILPSSTLPSVASSSTPPPSTATDNPTPTSTQEAPTPTLVPTPVSREYVVQEGDTLFGLALEWEVTVDDILAANAIPDASLIFPGDVLIIPGIEAVPVPETEPAATASPAAPSSSPTAGTPDLAGTPEQPSPSPTTAQPPAGDPGLPPQPDWPPSHINDDLAANYPLNRQTPSGALLVHFQPDTYPAQNIDSLIPRLDSIWAELLNQIGGQVGSQVDVRLAGTLFALNPGLQGYTQSGLYRTFVLVNGVFDDGEADYILAHELAHIVSTYSFGTPYTPMIHEGLALYLPQSYLTAGAGYLSHELICAAARQTADFRSASQLNQMGYGTTGFGGHIRTFLNYNLAGCFVGYLIETYGLARLDQIYSNGDYATAYGKSLTELDNEWQAHLANIAVPFDPVAFVNLVNEIGLAYDDYLGASTGGVHANWAAYVHITRARTAANQGQLGLAGNELAQYYSLMASTP